MIVYGKQPIFYLLEKKRNLVRKIILAKEVERDVFKKFSGLPIMKVDDLKAQAMAKGGNHQGILAEVEEFETISYREILEKSQFILVLYSVTDMGNIGSLVRTAYSLGVDGLIITGLNDVKFEGIARTSSGALFDSKIAVYKNIFDVINEAKHLNFKLYGATLDGENIKNISDNLPEKRILILGSEDIGLSGRVLSAIDQKVTIPMAREFDSLNVSVAGAILINYLRSQEQKNNPSGEV